MEGGKPTTRQTARLGQGWIALTMIADRQTMIQDTGCPEALYAFHVVSRNGWNCYRLEFRSDMHGIANNSTFRSDMDRIASNSTFRSDMDGITDNSTFRSSRNGISSGSRPHTDQGAMANTSE